MRPVPFANTRFVMVETTHPGNIGACARAMATMGFEDLRLVNPAQFPNPKATEMAVGASPILDRAKVYTDFPSAVADCALVFALTARARDHMPSVQSPRMAMQEWVRIAHHAPTAIVLGRERNGLENEILWQCHRLITIPVSPDYASLNVASAAQLIAYEARLAYLAHESEAEISNKFITNTELATHDDLHHLIAHTEDIMRRVGFYRDDKPHPLNAKLRTLAHRYVLERQDIRLMRGFLKEVGLSLNQHDKNAPPPLP